MQNPFFKYCLSPRERKKDEQSENLLMKWLSSPKSLYNINRAEQDITVGQI